ncbi:MAG: cytochrome c maturation protein CcmE [Pseudomonadota bacterium]
MSKKQRRLTIISGVFAVALLATGLTLTALNRAVALFYTPSELADLAAPPDGTIRLGGLVEAGSIAYGNDREARVAFTIADEFATTRVAYVGVLPDLFREGQGVVVQGRLGADGVLQASEVLAKHDETYMPSEVAEALKEQGRWRDGPES